MADRTKIRSYLAHRQGLLDFSNQSNREVLASTGWARSVGGHNIYISLFARNQSDKAQTEQDAKSDEIYEFASARGCTYFLPKEHFQTGIKAGQGFNDASAIRTAKTKLGFTDDDLIKLKNGILKTLEKGALDTNGLKKELGDLVVNFGEAGKKVGQTTSLSLGLLSLQADAKIRRVPPDWRLEAQTYSYKLFEGGPDVGDSYSKEQAYTDLATLFWQWVGIASLAHFQWFSGLGVKASQEATKNLGLVSVEGTDLLIRDHDLDGFRNFEVPGKPSYRLLTALDGLFLHRRDIQDLLDPADSERHVSKGRIGSLQDLYNNAIIDRGRIIGLWEFDVPNKELVTALFVPTNTQLESEIKRVEAFIRDALDDCRSFSLDSPKSRQESIDNLRAMSQ
jgi:hypothetical protein